MFGVYLLWDAKYDLDRGIAEVVPPSRSSSVIIIEQTKDPEGFQNLMTYQWIRAGLALGAGFILLGICRRADRLDPFSPTFGGEKALDELDDVLSKEQERRHRPLK